MNFPILLCEIDNYDKYSDLLHCWSSILSYDEKKKLEHLKFLKDKLNFLIGRVLVKNILNPRSPAEVKFASNGYGKLYTIDEKKLEYKYFNISHTHNMVAVVFSGKHEVGVDVEKKRPVDYKSLINYFASSDEKKRVLGSDDISNEFYKVWTIKEAYLKAVGVGLSNDITSINMAEVVKRNYILSFQKRVENKYMLSAVAIADRDVKKNSYGFRVQKITPDSLFMELSNVFVNYPG